MFRHEAIPLTLREDSLPGRPEMPAGEKTLFRFLRAWNLTGTGIPMSID
jgi:hypothetical protein